MGRRFKTVFVRQCPEQCDVWADLEQKSLRRESSGRTDVELIIQKERL